MATQRGRFDIRRLLPAGSVLPASIWEGRHRGIVWFLWAHVPALFAVGVLTHHAPLHVLADLQPIIIAAVGASVASFSRNTRAALATFGLVACSAILVHFSGGVIEMHFHFFVVVGIITLYQDWLPFGVALGFTVFEHGIVGVISPASVYNHHAAQTNPWLWAGIHGAFVLAASVPHVLSWRQNENQALRDPLTRLSNRTLVRDRLRHALATAQRDEAVALLFVDLDRFKQVNDTLGHAAGDELLVACSDRIGRCVRDEDVVGRLGGDEFAVVLLGPSADAAETIAQRVLDALTEPTVVARHEIVISASIGIAYGHPGSTADDLLRNADLAMYVAKSSGRARYEVFDGTMHDRAIERLELEGDLRQAITANDLTVACQPIIDMATGAVTGAEVLCRWEHPTRGPVSPGVFIPIAERTGLIHDLGRQVFAAACDVARRLAAIDPTLSTTVNVSPVQLADGNLPAIFAALLAEHGVEPSRIVVEVTETVLMQDVERSTQRLAELKRIGVRVAVDDFGVGHSSLSYLRNLPIDVLKIDKSFVDGLPDGSDLARMMIQLGRILGLDVVAEGVETVQQRDHLRVLGCPRAQGFLFARPQTVDSLVATIAGERVTDVA